MIVRLTRDMLLFHEAMAHPCTDAVDREKRPTITKDQGAYRHGVLAPQRRR